MKVLAAYLLLVQGGNTSPKGMIFLIAGSAMHWAIKRA
jgi:hypothetical protein